MAEQYKHLNGTPDFHVVWNSSRGLAVNGTDARIFRREHGISGDEFCLVEMSKSSKAGTLDRLPQTPRREAQSSQEDRDFFDLLHPASRPSHVPPCRSKVQNTRDTTQLYDARDEHEKPEHKSDGVGRRAILGSW
ncbi:hypothetical protein EW146_g9019 [Bondarzewia mesenterica]|uniref:Uncharacterized protein n=1 Tax=Bondarzewia mesenterica TaxID=1095465 RepID=A0A4S4LBL1_9AGAM|nr:hypothetical protein EW146_g9019 [Bondarzewia mesenterica]